MLHRVSIVDVNVLPIYAFGAPDSDNTGVQFSGIDGMVILISTFTTEPLDRDVGLTI